ncbi:MAG TPA: hypothetical protein VEK15_32430 [Vicinamibacteria bacterium]|nr:hypothetical protein [Vicinamibacteria bacterium]
MGTSIRLSSALFLSGAAALVYQLVWIRHLSLVLGNTFEAVATVLAIFMAGLGAGSALAARRADAQSGERLPRLFALLEVGTAAVALAFPPLLAGLTPAFRLIAETTPLLGLARVLLAVVLLLIPTTLMGATLPILVAHRERSIGSGVGRSSGILYAANTSGAVLGSLAAGIFLIEALGLRATTFLAVGFNFGAAGLALSVRGLVEPGEIRSGPRLSAGSRVALIVAFLSGLGALMSEVAWTRSLVLVMGPTSYGFSFIVASVIAGIALGSAIGARLNKGLFAVQSLAALASVGIIALLPRLVIPLGELVRTYADAMPTLLTVEFLHILGLLLIPSLCFGATFPLAVTMVGGAPARASGLTLAGNTAGAVVGSLLAGFVALPLLSAEATLYLAAFAHAVAAAIVFSPRRTLLVAAPAIIVAAFAVIPRWDPEIMAGGLYKYASYLEPGEFLDFLRRGELLFHEEDRATTVSVKRIGTRISLAVDGKVDATNREDLLTQRMLAHLPLLLHPEPGNVLVIGLGSGVTAGSALTHPIDQLEVVEISTGVVEAQRFFSDVNHQPTEDRRFRLIVGDGRNHLLLTDRRYDVVISEPSNPWMAGVSGLFTREWFALAKRRLSPSGLFCQWAHLYNFPEDDLRTLVGTFTDVFESSALFVLSESDVLLLGANGGFGVPSGDVIESRIERRAVADDLAEVGILGPGGLGLLYTMSTPVLSEWAQGVVRHTDDRPVLEFRAPRAMYADTSRSNRDRLKALAAEERAGPFEALRLPPSARELRARGRGLFDAESYDWAFETYSLSLELDPRSLEAQKGLVRSAVASARPEEAAERLQFLSTGAAPVEARIAMAGLHREYGRLDDAMNSLAQALRIQSENREALVLAADIAGERGELPAMANLARMVLLKSPLDAEAAALLAETSLRRGDYALAAEQSGAIVSQRPDAARAQKVLAIASAELDETAAARKAFDALVALEPEVFVHFNNYGRFELRSGDAEKAAELYERAVDLNPRNRDGYQGLEEAASRTGDDERLERARSMLSFLESRSAP